MSCSPHVHRGQGPGILGEGEIAPNNPIYKGPDIAEVMGSSPPLLCQARLHGHHLTRILAQWRRPQGWGQWPCHSLLPHSQSPAHAEHTQPSPRPGLVLRRQRQDGNPSRCWLFPWHLNYHQILEDVMNSPSLYGVPTVCEALRTEQSINGPVPVSVPVPMKPPL